MRAKRGNGRASSAGVKTPTVRSVVGFFGDKKVRSCVAVTPPQTADVRWLVWFCRRETKARRRFSFPLPFSLPRLALARWIRNKAIGKAGESEEMGGNGKREGDGNCRSLNSESSPTLFIGIHIQQVQLANIMDQNSLRSQNLAQNLLNSAE